MAEPKSEAQLRRLGKGALLGASFIWGSSFVVMKNTLDALPPLYLLAARFTLAAALLSLLFWKKWRLISRGYIKRGTAMGVFLFLAYTAQTYGLEGTTPSKNAFLTTVYCVIVPFLYWAVKRQKPQPRHIAAALLCMTGVGLVSLQGGFSVSAGDLLTLLGGVFYAAHIVTTKLCTREYDLSLLTVLQFIAVALFSLFSALLFDAAPQSVPAGAVGSLVYLAVMATAAALWLQSFGQKYTAPAQASLLLALEAVFGVACSMLFYGDRLTFRLALGFAVIFLSVLTSERGLPSLRREKKEVLP